MYFFSAPTAFAMINATQEVETFWSKVSQTSFPAQISREDVHKWEKELSKKTGLDPEFSKTDSEDMTSLEHLQRIFWSLQRDDWETLQVTLDSNCEFKFSYKTLS